MKYTDKYECEQDTKKINVLGKVFKRRVWTKGIFFTLYDGDASCEPYFVYCTLVEGQIVFKKHFHKRECPYSKVGEGVLGSTDIIDIDFKKETEMKKCNKKTKKRAIKWYGAFYDCNDVLVDTQCFYRKSKIIKTLETMKEAVSVEIYRKKAILRQVIPIIEEGVK